MAARKVRELSPAELEARKRYGGKTRKEYNALNSKFAKHQQGSREEHSRNGLFEVVGLYDGQLDKPHPAPFPVYSAALQRFQKLWENKNLRALKLVEYIPLFDEKGEPLGTKTKTWLSFQRAEEQRFANSKSERLWREQGQQALYSDSALRKNSSLKNLKLEYVRTIYSDGTPWWEGRA